MEPIDKTENVSIFFIESVPALYVEIKGAMSEVVYKENQHLIISHFSAKLNEFPNLAMILNTKDMSPVGINYLKWSRDNFYLPLIDIGLRKLVFVNSKNVFMRFLADELIGFMLPKLEVKFFFEFEEAIAWMEASSEV